MEAIFIMLLILGVVSMIPRSKIMGKQITNSMNMNQFSQTSQVGMLDLGTNPNPAVFTVSYNYKATSTNRLVPGEGVVLKDLGGDDKIGSIIVDERANANDYIFGVKLFSTKEGSEAPGGICEVATDGAVVYMNSGAAISRGASVALVFATAGNVVTATTESILGIALDKATGSNQLIRILVKPVKVAAPST
jgi:hypothetical protein